MAELPLSKFAPFCKYESKFQPEAMNKLQELNIQCKGCIYYNESSSMVNTRPPDDGMVRSSYDYDFPEGEILYHCDIFKEGEDYVAPHSLCRFFTAIEDVESEEAPDEELSIQIQKLDFSNSEQVTKSIRNLRDNIINEK